MLYHICLFVHKIRNTNRTSHRYVMSQRFHSGTMNELTIFRYISFFRFPSNVYVHVNVRSCARGQTNVCTFHINDICMHVWWWMVIICIKSFNVLYTQYEHVKKDHMCELTFCANFWHIPLSSLQLRSTIFVGHYSVHQLTVVSATCHYWLQRLNLAAMDMTKINETHSTKLFKKTQNKKSSSQFKSDSAVKRE